MRRQLLQQLLTALYQCPPSVMQQKAPALLNLIHSAHTQPLKEEVGGVIMTGFRAHAILPKHFPSFDRNLTRDGEGCAEVLPTLPFLPLLQSLSSDSIGEQTSFVTCKCLM